MSLLDDGDKMVFEFQFTDNFYRCSKSYFVTFYGEYCSVEQLTMLFRRFHSGEDSLFYKFMMFDRKHNEFFDDLVSVDVYYFNTEYYDGFFGQQLEYYGFCRYRGIFVKYIAVNWFWDTMATTYNERHMELLANNQNFERSTSKQLERALTRPRERRDDKRKERRRRGRKVKRVNNARNITQHEMVFIFLAFFF